MQIRRGPAAVSGIVWHKPLGQAPGRRQDEMIRSQKTGLMSLRLGVEPAAP